MQFTLLFSHLIILSWFTEIKKYNILDPEIEEVVRSDAIFPTGIYGETGDRLPPPPVPARGKSLRKKEETAGNEDDLYEHYVKIKKCSSNKEWSVHKNGRTTEHVVCLRFLTPEFEQRGADKVQSRQSVCQGRWRHPEETQTRQVCQEVQIWNDWRGNPDRPYTEYPHQRVQFLPHRSHQTRKVHCVRTCPSLKQQQQQNPTTSVQNVIEIKWPNEMGLCTWCQIFCTLDILALCVFNFKDNFVWIFRYFLVSSLYNNTCVWLTATVL